MMRKPNQFDRHYCIPYCVSYIWKHRWNRPLYCYWCEMQIRWLDLKYTLLEWMDDLKSSISSKFFK